MNHTAKTRARDPADYGPRAALARREIVDGPDPDNPSRNTRRARAHDPLLGLLASGAIDHAHWVAATSYRDAYALSQGARGGGDHGRLEPWQRCHYAARVADARAEVEAGMRAVGIRLSAVFVGAVLLQAPLREIERDQRIRNGAAGGLVAEALERLAVHQSR